MRKKVLIIQPSVQHYRLPIFDQLVKTSEKDFSITVCGDSDKLNTMKGLNNTRDYISHIPFKQVSILGQKFSFWKGLHSYIKKTNPDVIIAPGGMKYLDTWSLPFYFKKSIIGWSKISTYSIKNSTLLQFIKTKYFNQYKKLIVYGEASKDELLKLGIQNKNIYVAQNTINTTEILKEKSKHLKNAQKLREENNLESKKIILMVGRMIPEKRHKDLLEAWPEIHKRFPDACLVLVGKGPLFDELKASQKDESIIFTGYVDHGMDIAWIAASDLTIHPGSVGLAINQALVLGKPTIIADEIGSDTEPIKDKITGWRFERGNIKALVDCVSTVFNNEKKTKEISEQGKEWILKNASLENMVRTIKSAIESVIKI